MSATDLKAAIDVAITNQTADDSVNATTVGTQMKAIVDFAAGNAGGSYTLPAATADTLGGVKQGVNVSIAEDGTISVIGGSATETGNAISFVTSGIHDFEGTPLTGNITSDLTNAVKGITNLAIHNDTTEPTFDANFKRLTGSAEYVTGIINYIFCMYDGTHILYSINQTL